MLSYLEKLRTFLKKGLDFIGSKVALTYVWLGAFALSLLMAIFTQEIIWALFAPVFLLIWIFYDEPD